MERKAENNSDYNQPLSPPRKPSNLEKEAELSYGLNHDFKPT
jgi:hypothetical protein